MRRRRIKLALLEATLAMAACAPTGGPAPNAAQTQFAAVATTAQVEEQVGEGVTLADVLFVRASLESDATWDFQVTVRHEDVGWEHYADRWEVLTSGGEVLATRVLAHPHVDEQPFVRSLGAIVMPEETTQVTVRAHDGVHGYGGREIIVDLLVSEGEDYEVVR